MKTFGDAEARWPNKSQMELRVFRDSQPILTIYNDKCDDVRISASVYGVTYSEFRLRAYPAEIPEFEVGVEVEVWVSRDGNEPLALLGRTRVDFVDTTQDGSDTPKMLVQSRSPAAVLFDTAAEFHFHGELGEFVAEIMEANGVHGLVELSPANVKCWVSTPSAYGALRLIGLSMDFVVETQRDGSIHVLDRELSAERAASRPVRTLTDEDIRGFTSRQGAPVKRPSR